MKSLVLMLRYVTHFMFGDVGCLVVDINIDRQADR